MANTQTAVPLFVANAVLTAAQQNISDGTGTPVFATTVTRDAAFGGSNKALAEGQLCYIEASNIVQYYDGAAWATVGPAAAPGLVLVKSQIIGTTVSSVAVTSVFSTTYDTYKVVINGGVGSTNQNLNLQLGSTTTGYYHSGYNASYTGTLTGQGAANAASFGGVGVYNTNIITFNCEILNPFNTDETLINAFRIDPTTGGGTQMVNGYLNNQTSYTDFTLTPASGTLTGGTIYVYGYAKA